MLLALDTSTSVASVALVRMVEGDATPEGGETAETLAELTWNVGQRHSAELFPRLEALLALQRANFDAVRAIAVALGPGSFNGVRVALTTAKTLAFALGVPLYGHATLDAHAWGYASAPGPLWALLDAGRGQVYAAAYATPAFEPLGWAPLAGYQTLTPEELAAQAPTPVVFCGEWRAETRRRLDAALGERARFAATLGGRRASWLAQLALARHARGRPDDPLALDALYLRRPAITTSARKMGLAPPPSGAEPGVQSGLEQGGTSRGKDDEEMGRHSETDAKGAARALHR